MIKAFIVDDEQNNVANLKFMLEHDCTNIEVVGTASNGTAAREWLHSNNTDVVFLDISMPHETGIQMLALMPERNFKVIFVTAHNEYAIQAIKASAIDYILKPINITELQQAVEKLKNQHLDNSSNNLLVNHLLQTLQQKHIPTKIAIPQLGSTTFLDINEIVSIQAYSNYSII